MALRAALVDRAFIQRRRADARKVEGRTVHSMTESPEIRCRLTLNATGERVDQGRKIVESRPTVILYRKDRDGEAVVPLKTDRLRIVSRELGEAVYEIDGKPEPMRKKRRILGWSLPVVRLEED